MNTNQPAAKDLGRHAVDQGPSAAAEGLETAAAALREGVDGLPGGDRVKDFARAATDRLSSGADFLRSRDPERIKQTLLYQLTNMGQPFIYVVDGNYCNRGELYLAHKHNGLDIEIKYAVETLKNIWKVWQRPVHLQAQIDDDMMLFSYAGDQPKQQTIHEDLPKPAHQVG